MNICYINPTNNIRRPIAELANLLAEQGHNISIMYPLSKDCPTQNWVANDTIKNGQIKLIPLKSWYFSPLRYNLPNLFELFKKTKEVLTENDKVHIWEYYYPLSVFPLFYSLFNKKNKEKIILTTDGFVGYSYKPKGLTWLFKIYTQLIARFLFKIPKVMTTYGKSMVPYAKKAGVPLSKLQVIPTGIHLDKFQNPDQNKIKLLKQEFNLQDEKIILFVGMLTERKHPEIVIKVSQRLLNEGYNIKTLIVGDAHGQNLYRRLVAERYKNKIIFTGGRKDIPELMHLADVLLLPSEGEGLPGVVMEAMASGLPVVATDEGCTPDLIEDRKEGFLVNNRDYLHSVREVLGEKHLQLKIVGKAGEKIARYSWKKVVPVYQKLYQEMNRKITK